MIGVFNWALFLAINGLVLYSSWALAGRLLRREADPAILMVAAGLLWFSHATLVVLLLGVALQALNLLSVSLTSALLSAAVILTLRGERPPPLLRPGAAFLREILSSRDWFLVLMLALFASQAVILIAKVAFLPAHIWDVFFYHLTPAVEWFQQERIPHEIATTAPHMNRVPLGMTVLNYWFFIFFRNDFLARMPMLLWALLLVPTTFAILRRGGVDARWSLKFALLTFFIPIVLMQGVTAKDHLGLNVGLIAGLLFLAEYLRTKNAACLAIAAAAFGLILGYKNAAPAYVAVSGIVFLVFLAVGDRQAFADRVRRTAFLKASLISALLVVAIGGYWYFKRFLVGKVPLATGVMPPPRAVRGGEEEAVARFSWEAAATNISEFLPRTFDYRMTYGADLVFMSGFGPQFAAFGLIAMAAAVLFLFRRTEYRQPVFLIVVTALVLFGLFLSTNYSTNSNSYRILSFLPMAMIPWAAILMQRYGFFGKRLSAIGVNLLIVAAMAWNLVTILPPAYTNPRTFKEFISLDAPYRTSARYTQWASIHRPDPYRLLGSIPAAEPIALVSQPRGNYPGEPHGQTWSYLYYDRNWQRKLLYLHQPDHVDCDRYFVCTPKPALVEALRRNGASLVSLCMNNRCLQLSDPRFLELAPGFYFYDTARDL